MKAAVRKEVVSMGKKKTYRGELVDEIRGLGQSQGLNHVFTTFLEIAATCISAEMDPSNAEEREKRYEEMTSAMDPKTLNCYAHMLALLAFAIHEHEEDPCDILGSIYHELRLNNEWNGQYFTPDNVCRMMAQLVNPVDERPEAEDPIMINEPTCGSGTMVIGAVWAMKQKDFDFRHKSFFVAQDIDIRCVWMAYIQLSLYGIPAVVIHGDTLARKEWSRWYTPLASVPFIKRECAVNSTEKGAATSG